MKTLIKKEDEGSETDSSLPETLSHSVRNFDFPMILPSGKIYAFLLVQISLIDTGPSTRIISLFGIASVKTAILFCLRNAVAKLFFFCRVTTGIRLTFVTKEGWGAGCLPEKEPFFSFFQQSLNTKVSTSGGGSFYSLLILGRNGSWTGKELREPCTPLQKTRDDCNFLAQLE